MNSLNLIGIYGILVSDDEMRFIADEVCAGMEEAEQEVAGLVLVEIQVSDASEDFDVGLIHSEGSDQAPWDEKYFSIDGHLLVGDGSKRPPSGEFRVCFFLHRFDPESEIVSPYGHLKCVAVTEMPERLSKICIYEHPG